MKFEKGTPEKIISLKNITTNHFKVCLITINHHKRNMEKLLAITQKTNNFAHDPSFPGSLIPAFSK